MSQNGEGSASQDIEIEPEKEKDPINVRISLFFDGTLNNRENIEEREAYEVGNIGASGTTGQSLYMRNRGDDNNNSYDNGRTNIAVMEPHLKDKADGYDVYAKHYIAGQGAFTHKKDSVWGYAFGIGKSGVVGRAVEGIGDALNSIASSDEIDVTAHYIKLLTIDVFGFSRGAATARNAIYMLFNHGDSYYDEFTEETIHEFYPIHELLADRGYDIKPSAVELRFAGLYDTVLSYIVSQKSESSNNVLNQTAVHYAQNALHLAAADEHRADFPLHNIKCTKSNGGEEYFLPGVHSDIGGSYNQANSLKINENGEEEFMRTSNENMVINEGKKKSVLEQDKLDLIEQGWYLDNEIKVTSLKVKKKRAGKIPYLSINHLLKVNRKNISSAYSQIPLKIMAKYARKPEVKLTISNKLERRAKKILATDPKLKKLENLITEYVRNNKNSKASDWHRRNGKPPKGVGKWPSGTDKNFLKKIRHEHFHFSSKPGLGYSPNIEWNEDEKKYIRVRFEYDA